GRGSSGRAAHESTAAAPAMATAACRAAERRDGRGGASVAPNSSLPEDGCAKPTSGRGSRNQDLACQTGRREIQTALRGAGAFFWALGGSTSCYKSASPTVLERLA